MKLIIDIGNTLVKAALFEKKELIRSIIFEECTLINLELFIDNDNIERTILSTVKNIDEDTVSVIEKFQALTLSKNTLMPIKVKYKTPHTLGNDRLANAVAASHLYEGKDVLVLDAGTCLKMDIVNNKKEYLGGRISPGLKMRYKSLNQFTAHLPLCDIVDSCNFFGDDTISSIQSGVQNGIISEIDLLIDAFMKENKDAIVIITGGDCFFFEKALKNSIFADPFLMMKGLNVILDYNE